MIQNLITSLLISSAIGLGANNVKYTNTIEKPNEILNVSYNDSAQIIILDANELNNYVFVNLNNLFDELYSDGYMSDFGSSFILYNSNDISFDEMTEEYIFYAGDTYSLEYSYGYNDPKDGKFILYSDSEVFSFEYGIEWQLPSLEIYTQVKNAIQLDIKANTDSKYMNPLVEIISIITGGIGAFAANLGTGVSTYVSALFLNNGNLSVFGAVVAIFAGIALAVGLSRLIFNWIISLGGKK